MDLQFTAVFRQVPEGYIGFVEELPGANTQGATLEEARANLQEAVAMILDANRALAQQSAGKGPVIRETLKVSASNGGRLSVTLNSTVAGCSGKVATTQSSSAHPAEHRQSLGTQRSTTTSPGKSAKTSASQSHSDAVCSTS